MVESSSLDITPKEEHVTLDRPESLNLFLPVTQVEFTFDEITFTPNNEVALIYPSHPNQEYFMVVSDFISKCCLKEAFTRSPTQYQESLKEFWYTAKTLEDSKVWVSTPTGGVKGEIGITTFKNAIRAHYLPHSSMYVPPPSITTIRPWFATTGYRGEIGAKGTLKKSCLAPRVRSGLRRKQSSKHTSESTTEASKSQSGHSKKETKPSSAMDTSPSHHSPPTPVVGEMHKEAQQAAGGPTSLGDTSEDRAHPQLSSDRTKSAGDGLKTSTSFILHSESASGHDALADSTAEVDPGLSAPNDSISS
ncbi:hypothetical protein Tco_0544017 [Tanacetum coccineum]